MEFTATAMQGDFVDLLMAPLLPMELTTGRRDSRLLVGLVAARRAMFEAAPGLVPGCHAENRGP